MPVPLKLICSSVYDTLARSFAPPTDCFALIAHSIVVTHIHTVAHTHTHTQIFARLINKWSYSEEHKHIHINTQTNKHTLTYTPKQKCSAEIDKRAATR